MAIAVVVNVVCCAPYITKRRAEGVYAVSRDTNAHNFVENHAIFLTWQMLYIFPYYDPNQRN